MIITSQIVILFFANAGIYRFFLRRFNAESGVSND